MTLEKKNPLYDDNDAIESGAKLNMFTKKNQQIFYAEYVHLMVLWQYYLFDIKKINLHRFLYFGQ